MTTLQKAMDTLERGKYDRSMYPPGTDEGGKAPMGEYCYNSQGDLHDKIEELETYILDLEGRLFNAEEYNAMATS